MFSKTKRWLESKKGKNALIGVLSVALALSLMSQAGLLEGLSGLLTGTAGPGMGGYSCLPTCVETDGKFLSMPSGGLDSFGGQSIVLWIEAPATQNSFEVGIFDGDSGLDNSGAVNMWEGNWDNTDVETTYTLYADPDRDGTGSTVVRQWKGNTELMPNNGWFVVDVTNVEEARNSEGIHNYRFEATRPLEGTGINAFKLRSTGRLSSGRSDMVDSDFAIVGMMVTLSDIDIIYPNHTADWTDYGESTYTGDWEFYFDVPAGTKTISFWDGDFDRGTAATPDGGGDTDDPNTVGVPSWANSFAVAERAGGTGSPADDASLSIMRRTPPVYYEVIGPDGTPVFVNEEPSGTEEWEEFVVSADPDLPDEDIDLRVDRIPPGYYKLHVVGLDVHNTVWFRINYEISDTPPVCPECPICETCQVCPDCPCLEPTPEPTQEPTPEPTPEETPPPDPEICQTALPVDVLYVLDISGSMDELYPGEGRMGTKLAAAKDAIMALNSWVEAQGNGSRVALSTFRATQSRGNQYASDIKLVSGFTDDINGFNAQLLGLRANGWTPTAFAVDGVTQWLPGQLQAGRNPLVVLLSDGVPTMDYDSLIFDGGRVEKVNVYDQNGVALPVDTVRTSGTAERHGQTAGEPVADVMVAINNLKAAMPDVPVSVIAIQAAPGEHGVFNDQVLRYVAERGAGDFFASKNPEDLQSALKWIFVETACDEGAPPPANPPQDPPTDAGTCANYQLASQERAQNKRARLQIQNNHGQDAVAATFHLTSWPAEWGNLEGIRVFGSNMSVQSGAAPVDVPLSGQTIRPGGSEDIVLQFSNSISDDVSGLTGYVEFDNGCRVAFGSGDPTPPESTPEPPAGPTPEPPAGPSCDSPIRNMYGIENPTTNPFYGIKFEYQSGTEVKNGGVDEFTYVLPADVAAAMTAMQLEAKAARFQEAVTLAGCNFAGSGSCGPVQDQHGRFELSFMGAADNGDGTLTLRFRVKNNTNRGLSHATFGLPSGIVPPNSGNYESQVCP